MLQKCLTTKHIIRPYSLESYYDERGRVIYESGYITHGELEYFYIYGDEGEKPQYLLTVDYGGGYAVPDMKRYR